MFVDFKEFVSSTPETVAEILDFVGADPDQFDFKKLPPGMKVKHVSFPIQNQLHL